MRRSLIPESSKSWYRMSDHKPNSALPLQLDDLTTETNSPEQIQLITATNSPEQIHLATSIDSLGGDINIREGPSQKISCGSVLSKYHCVKSKRNNQAIAVKVIKKIQQMSHLDRM